MSQKIFASIIDQILDGSEPDYAAAGLTEAKSSGDDWLDLTHDETDKKFVNSLTADTDVSKGGAKAAKEKNKKHMAHRNEGVAEADPFASGLKATASDWQQRAAKTVGDDNILADAVTMESAKSGDPVEKREISDAEIKSVISDMLNQGIEPNKIAAKLDKLAEVALYNRSMAAEYLNENGGVLGMAYLEPNHFMASCEATHKRLAKQGGVRAKSVKKISACEGCSHYRKANGCTSCSLYRLPIVASKNELLPIIDQMTGSAKNKKAALVQIANRETERPVEAKTSSMISRNTDAVVQKTAQGNRTRKEEGFDSAEVARLHTAGASLEKIYDFGVKKAGAVKTTKAIREFVAGLKRTNTKIALSQIDCSFLKGKLATSNAIIGEKKCATCTYRKGMHCGLTGGTLLSYPGMDKAASNHKIAADAPKDGHQMISEFELTRRPVTQDISTDAPEAFEVETKGTFGMDI